jgi:hypothetical protein
MCHDTGRISGGIVHSREAFSKETAMNLKLESPVLTLGAGQLLALDDARGTRIQPREGTVWITEEGETQDFIVEAGQAFVVKRHGRTLVQALVDSRIAFRDEELPRSAGELLGEEHLLETRFRLQRHFGV